MAFTPKKKILVPTDFSDRSFEALEAALELAESPASIHVVYVLLDLSPMEPSEIWGTMDIGKRTKGALEALKKRLTAPKYQDAYRDVQCYVEFGDPSTQVIEYAKREKADMIVLTSHGRTGLSHLLIGSVAERIIRMAHCPVLVLRK
jgi:nucleotide-binding universal stress UspA family protein